jgi:hypothetical protein
MWSKRSATDEGAVTTRGKTAAKEEAGREVPVLKDASVAHLAPPPIAPPHSDASTALVYVAACE